ncbi:DUF7576 family protein [Natronolimnobius baerhuensis]|uniref:Uncharacterized protein n=1 Tax=Natronolimnobius baerhuensis TaxID=253108 RepID=A0A202EBG6_9EURY|nr:hypothetical protein [Natronolimnobius baerhuensis]OVE85567.1 hypothetical protein B2G88_01715 [Natronolimnobius baerhuensis]
MNSDPDSTTTDAASLLETGSHLKHEATVEAVSDGVETHADTDDTTVADGSLSMDSDRLEPQSDRCRSCGTAIGPREYRLSWLITDGAATLEAHYCSESCLPDDAPSGSTTADEATASSESDRHSPQDWSYCR